CGSEVAYPIKKSLQEMSGEMSRIQEASCKDTDLRAVVLGWHKAGKTSVINTILGSSVVVASYTYVFFFPTPFKFKHHEELRMVLLGWVMSGKSSAGNTLLNREEFVTRERTTKCKRRSGDVAGRKITVLDTPGYWKFFSPEFNPEWVKAEVFKGVSQFKKFPHAMLLVLPADTSFTDEQKKIIIENMAIFGEQIWRHSIVLFTWGDFLGNASVEQHIESEGDALQWLIKKCGNRYHVFENTKRGDNAQVIELLEKIEEMVAGNCLFRPGVTELCENTMEQLPYTSEDVQVGDILKPLKEEWNRRTKEFRENLEKLLSKAIKPSTECDRSITPPPIFDEEKESIQTSETSGSESEVDSAQKFGIKEQLLSLLEREWSRQEAMVMDNVHEILLKPSQVRVTGTEMRAVVLGWHKAGKTSLINTILGSSVVVAVSGQCVKKEGYVRGRRVTLVDTPGWWKSCSIRDSPELSKQAIMRSVSICPPGPQVFLLVIETGVSFKDKYMEPLVQRLELLSERVWRYTIVLFTGGESLTDTTIEQHIQSEGETLQRLLKKCGNRYHVIDNISKGDGSQVEELFGKIENVVRQNDGRSFETDVTVLQELQGKWEDVQRRATARQSKVLEERSLIKDKVLLVLPADTPFKEEQKKIIKENMAVFGEQIWRHTIVLFTWGDFLGNASAEQHIENEGEALQWLIKKCGNRYHVFDNIKRGDAQVIELLEKIEEMVAGNCLFRPGVMELRENNMEQLLDTSEDVQEQLLSLLEREWSRQEAMVMDNVHEILLKPSQVREASSEVGEDEIKESVAKVEWWLSDCKDEKQCSDDEILDDSSTELASTISESTGELPPSSKIPPTPNMDYLHFYLQVGALFAQTPLYYRLLQCLDRNDGTPEKCDQRDMLNQGVFTNGWWKQCSIKDSPELSKQAIMRSVSMFPPGPQVFLLVIETDVSFKKKYVEHLMQHMELLSERVWRCTIVLFTGGDSLTDTTIEQHIQSEGETLQRLLKECGNRYHVIDNINKGDGSQVEELFEKIENVVRQNDGRNFETDVKVLQELQGKWEDVQRRATARQSKVLEERSLIKDKGFVRHLEELRLVLLGWVMSGKSSAGNTILNREEFVTGERTTKCRRRCGDVAGRRITVLDTPGYWKFFSLEFNPEWVQTAVHKEVLRCKKFPHAMLLVLPADTSFKEEQKKIIIENMAVFGEQIWRHTIVLFTWADFLEDALVEQHIESEGEALQWLIDKCGNRYHVFDYAKKDDNAQVIELLEKIEEMVAGNCLFRPGVTELREDKMEQLLDTFEEVKVEVIVKLLKEEWNRKTKEFKENVNKLLAKAIWPSGKSLRSKSPPPGFGGEKESIDSPEMFGLHCERFSTELSDNLTEQLQSLLEREWSRQETIVMEKVRAVLLEASEASSQAGESEIHASVTKVEWWLSGCKDEKHACSDDELEDTLGTVC
ncbi:hypothetical protein NFI96_030178, partial [Prochilodus magdalenae]